MFLLIWFLALPTLRTFIISLYDRDSQAFVGFQNYIDVFKDRLMLVTLRNNLMWIIFGASSAVVMGLVVAILADRSSFENLAKALIFLPMAISLVGAGVIWKFIYALRDADSAQIGLLNAIVVAFGGEPQAWISTLQPWNNLFDRDHGLAANWLCHVLFFRLRSRGFPLNCWRLPVSMVPTIW